MVLDLGGRTNDFVALVLTAMMGIVFASFGPAGYFDWSFVKQESPAKEIWLMIISIPLASVCFWIAFQGACRLFSNQPDAIIDETGIVLPTWIASTPISWSEISASRVRRIEGGRIGVYWELELQLKTPIRALASFYWPTRKITLGSRMPPRIKEAGRIVRHYRLLAGWKR
ncbi:hypothetical protein [Novosphingobium sp. PASSN1]|uniref:hypothetical protein n=1 Tax=Novosphingobium sp. PASSN1 TaxID=2015561 RepID=UPI000BC5E196|nr:hypothetical protein [Novosphingobium sp. PASSN1]OYU33366.1 MAG: hypothetical protein CFE35_20700 [Novosphingobium sp. PASSN1]